MVNIKSLIICICWGLICGALGVDASTISGVIICFFGSVILCMLLNNHE